MSTKQLGRDETVSLPYYLPATPRASSEPGRLERFVKGLDKGPRL